MNICGYEPTDLVNGEGVRCTLWVSGCIHKCKGCFNQKAWSYDYGNPLTDGDIERIIKDLGRPFIKGLSIMGGDPLDPRNIEGVIEVLKCVRENFGNTKDIMVWTGYTFNEVPEVIKELVDIVMDGKYVEDKPTSKRFRGSDNQHMWIKTEGVWRSD